MAPGSLAAGPVGVCVLHGAWFPRCMARWGLCVARRLGPSMQGLLGSVCSMAPGSLAAGPAKRSLRLLLLFVQAVGAATPLGVGVCVYLRGSSASVVYSVGGRMRAAQDCGQGVGP